MNEQPQPQQPLQPEPTPPVSPDPGNKKYIVIGILALIALFLLAIASVILANRLDSY